jgi:hypothetical protein
MAVKLTADISKFHEAGKQDRRVLASAVAYLTRGINSRRYCVSTYMIWNHPSCELLDNVDRCRLASSIRESSSWPPAVCTHTSCGDELALHAMTFRRRMFTSIPGIQEPHEGQECVEHCRCIDHICVIKLLHTRLPQESLELEQRRNRILWQAIQSRTHCT